MHTLQADIEGRRSRAELFDQYPFQSFSLTWNHYEPTAILALPLWQACHLFEARWCEGHEFIYKWVLEAFQLGRVEGQTDQTQCHIVENYSASIVHQL